MVRCVRNVRRGPVIEIVSDFMALAAVRELCHYTCRMRRTMAVAALRHHLMFLLMAECTGKWLVLGFTGRQKA